MVKGNLYIFVAFSLSFQINQSWACSYKPFDLQITQKNTGVVTRGSKGLSPNSEADLTPLQFAKGVVSDATTIQSDSPFLKLHMDGKAFTWKLDVGADSQIASENTMLEIYGYFKDFLGVDLPSDFLTQRTMKAFDQISGHALMKFPNSSTDDALIENAVRGVFRGNSEGIIKKMREKNAKPERFGLPHFSRPSYLSSKKTRDTYGDATILACMTMAYARDAYTNPLVKDQHPVIAQSVLRSSVLDFLASEAIVAKNKERSLSSVSVGFGDGKVDCRLVPSEDFKLQPVVQVKCPAVVQTDPVIRNFVSVGGDELSFVQVGYELFTVQCAVNGKHVNMSRSFSEVGDLEKLMTSAVKATAKKNPLAKRIQDNIGAVIRPTSGTEGFITETVNQCDKALAGKSNPISREDGMTARSGSADSKRDHE